MNTIITAMFSIILTITTVTIPVTNEKVEVVDNNIEVAQEANFKYHVDDEDLSHWEGVGIRYGSNIIVNEMVDGWYHISISNEKPHDTPDQTGEWEGMEIHARDIHYVELTECDMDVFNDTMMQELINEC